MKILNLQPYFEGDTPVGIDVEVLTEIMKTQNVEVNFKMKPWNSCIHDLDMQRIDAVIPMVYSKERGKIFIGSSIRTRGNYLVVKKKKVLLNKLWVLKIWIS